MTELSIVCRLRAWAPFVRVKVAPVRRRSPAWKRLHVTLRSKTLYGRSTGIT